MATLTYAGTDFLTTLGGLPTVSREILRELDPNSLTVIKERHIITLEWTGVPAEGQSLDTDQSDIADIEAAIEALAQDGALIYKRNSGDVAWEYNAPNATATAFNHVVPNGIKITKIGFPHGPAKAVTNTPLRVVFEANVIVCSNDPIPGVASLSYTVTEEWDTGGLLTVVYQGTLCACKGKDVRDLLRTLMDGTFTPDARQRWTQAGHVLGNGFGPMGMGVTELDQVITCVSFRINYGGGDIPDGLDATTLRLAVNTRIIQNWIVVNIIAVYGYRGSYVGTGGPPLIFGAPFGGLIGSGFGSASGLFGLPGGGVGGSGGFYGNVFAEAWDQRGVDVRAFLPPGAGAVFLRTEPKIGVNTASNEISSDMTYYARWVHDEEILTYDETVELDVAEPEASGRVLMNDESGTQHRPYVQEAGWGESYVTFTVTIVSKTTYYELPDRLNQDRVNIWKVRSSPFAYDSKLPNQIHPVGLAGSPPEGFTTSRVSQRYLVRDPGQVGTLKQIVVGSIKKLQTFIGGAPVKSGDTSGHDMGVSS